MLQSSEHCPHFVVVHHPGSKKNKDAGKVAASPHQVEISEPKAKLASVSTESGGAGEPSSSQEETKE